METAIKRLYEGLFLIDSAKAASDWDGAIGAIEKVLSRAESEVVSLSKWDERRLAYDVKGKERGTYILTYFKCDPLKITAIERDVQLSEDILRVMVLTTDRMSQEDIERETPLGKTERMEKEAQERVAAKAQERAEAEAVAEIEAKAKAKSEEAEVEAVVEVEAEASVEVEAEAQEPVAEPAEEGEAKTEEAGE